MLHETSLDESNQIIEAKLSSEEEHVLHLLEDMQKEIIWINRTQQGIIPGTLDTLKMYYTDLESFHILESLVRKGMLERIDNGIVLLCPSCGSHQASILKSCPSCGSIKLRKKQKIVHTPCEHWGTYDEFKGGKTFTCPVCNDQIESDKILENQSGFSYSDPYYECQKCGFAANKVRNMFLCTTCKSKFQDSKAVQLEQTGFKLAVEVVKPKEEAQAPVETEEEPEAPMEASIPKTKKNRRSFRLLEELTNIQKKRKKVTKELPDEIPEVEVPKDKPELPVKEPVEQTTQIKPTLESPEKTEPQGKPSKTEPEKPELQEPAVEEHEEESAIEDVIEKLQGDKETEITEEPADDTDEKALEAEIIEETPSVGVEELTVEKVIEEPLIEPVEEKVMEPPVEVEVIEEPRVKEIIEEESPVEDQLEEEVIDAPAVAEINEDPEKVKIEEKPPVELVEEDPASKVLFVVEDQMVCNFVLDELQKSKKQIVLTLIEDGSQALKSLRTLYDMIIFDCEIDSVDPKFVLNEMGKWKIKSPLVIMEASDIGAIPRELNVVARIKRKQRDIRKMRRIISKHI